MYIKEGLVQTHGPEALARAAAFDPPANAWSLLWFGAQVAARNGDYDKAVTNIREILRGGFAQAAGRGFDFTKDYRVLVQLISDLNRQVRPRLHTHIHTHAHTHTSTYNLNKKKKSFTHRTFACTSPLLTPAPRA